MSQLPCKNGYHMGLLFRNDCSVTTSLAQHPPATHCHNCGAAVDYHYCQVCGQGTQLHVPSASEFIHEFVGHYVAIEGRLWKTVANLLLRPGFLTAEYIAGRRVRYVEPLRVYLTFSIIFFALLKLMGPSVVDMGTPIPPERPAKVAKATGQAASASPADAANAAEAARDQAEAANDRAQAAREKAEAAAAKAARDGKQEITFASPTTADGKENKARKIGPLAEFDMDPRTEEALTNISPAFRDKVTGYLGKSAEEKTRVLQAAFFAYVPYAMFLMMPLFALYLKVLYLGSGKRYGEHLLFALHTNAFAFAMFALMIVISPLEWGIVNFAMIVWLVIYLPKAMRRVYGGGRWATLLRWSVLSTCHLFSIVLAIVSAFGMAIIN